LHWTFVDNVASWQSEKGDMLHCICQTLDTPEGTQPREDSPRVCMLDCLHTVLVVDWVEKINFLLGTCGLLPYQARCWDATEDNSDEVLGAFLVLVVATEFFKK
jgi:hypothetical protein